MYSKLKIIKDTYSSYSTSLTQDFHRFPISRCTPKSSRIQSFKPCFDLKQCYKLQPIPYPGILDMEKSKRGRVKAQSCWFFTWKHNLGMSKNPDINQMVFPCVIVSFSSYRFSKCWLHTLMKQFILCFLRGISPYNHQLHIFFSGLEWCDQLLELLELEDLLEELLDVDWASPFKVAIFLCNRNFCFSALRAFLAICLPKLLIGRICLGGGLCSCDDLFRQSTVLLPGAGGWISQLLGPDKYARSHSCGSAAVSLWMVKEQDGPETSQSVKIVLWRIGRLRPGAGGDMIKEYVLVIWKSLVCKCLATRCLCFP